MSTRINCLGRNRRVRDPAVMRQKVSPCWASHALCGAGIRRVCLFAAVSLDALVLAQARGLVYKYPIVWILPDRWTGRTMSDGWKLLPLPSFTATPPL